MADEQLTPGQLTTEQITTLLTELFVNQNNLDKTYYDMFYNPTPMDIKIQRYDENGVLQTYMIPNRAKDKNGNGLVMLGTVAPEGVVQASAGQFYLNITSYILYYKATGESTSAYGWMQIYSPLILENDALPVHLGGTGITSVQGIVKGNGQLPFSQATEFMSNLSPDDPSYDIATGDIDADYMNPNSVINKTNALISTHNTDITAHSNIIESIQNNLDELNALIESLSSKVTMFPDYVNRKERYSNTDYTATENGWVYLYRYAMGSGSTNITINGVNFPIFLIAYGITGDGVGAGGSNMFPIKKGDTYRVDSASSFWFIPARS